MTTSAPALALDPAVRAKQRAVKTRNQTVRRAIAKHPIGFVAALFLIGLVMLAIFEGALPLPDARAQSLVDRLLEPMERGSDGSLRLLGADQLGRDVLARLLVGARISLGIAIGTVILSGVVGSFVGLVAGYKGGAFDQIAMRLVDVQMAVPPMLLAIFLLYLIGPSLFNLVLLLAVLSWWSYARVVRAETLRVRSMAYIEAAVVSGASQWRILFRHILPQLTPVLVVIAVLDFATVILAEAGISYLGFGVQPPNTSWGRMVSEGQQFVTSGAWWLFIAPGAAIFVTVLLVRLSSEWIQALVGPSRKR